MKYLLASIFCGLAVPAFAHHAQDATPLHTQHHVLPWLALIALSSVVLMLGLRRRARSQVKT